MPILRDRHEFDDFEHVGPHVQQSDWDRSEHRITSEKCAWCRASLDYCRANPCGQRVAGEQPAPHCDSCTCR